MCKESYRFKTRFRMLDILRYITNNKLPPLIVKELNISVLPNELIINTLISIWSEVFKEDGKLHKQIFSKNKKRYLLLDISLFI